MNLLSPQPRFKIYTKPTSYLHAIKDIVLNKHKRGDDLEKFIQHMENYFNVPYVLPMPTARFAIYLAIKNIIKPGQKVILSPLTIVDVVNMVICAGGIPVFADVGHNTCNIDPDSIAQLIDQDTGAVLITHLHGLACDMDKIVEICQQANIPLIEDSAQAFSTRYQGQYVGTFGKVGIFSFGMYKNVNAFFGGMLMTDDKLLYEKIKSELESLPNFPLQKYLKKFLFAMATDVSTMPGLFQGFTYWVFRHAFLRNVDWINDIVTVDRYPEKKTQLPSSYLQKMLPMQARLILNQLDTVEEHNNLRLKKAELYYQGLKDISDIIVPPMHSDFSHLYTYYPIQVPDRRDLMSFGLRHKRDWVLSHYHNCANLPCFENYKRDCPVAERTAYRLLYLPTYPRYGMKEVEKNISVINKYFGRKS